MAEKHKFVLIPVSENKVRIKKHMVEFVNERYLLNKDTTLQDIQNIFQKPPYNLSEGTVWNYLNELVKARKLSTVYRNKRRYYLPPKIPLSIKFGVSVGLIISVLGVIVDNFVPKDILARYVFLYNYNQMPIHPSILPVVIYLLILTVIFTVFSYLLERQK